MKGKSITLLFCAVIASTCAFSQTTSFLFKGNILPKKITDTSTKVNRHVSPSMLVAPTFYTTNLAFFCRQELKFEKVTKIPLKFRLGSVQQVDYLEGKGQRKY